MGARHADRLWMIGGVIAIAVLSAVAYLMLISPQYAEADGLRAQTDDARSQASTIRSRIVELKKDKANLTKLKATLTTYQDALPSDSGVPAFLRQLQAAGTDLGVSVNGITVGAPATTSATGVKQLPIQLTVTGSPEKLNEFMTELQGGGQKRAVLIDTASWADADGGKGLSVVLHLNAFVAPPTDAGAPAVTTD